MYVKKKNIREGKTKIIITNNSFDFKHFVESIDIKCFIYTFYTKEDWPALKTISSFIQVKSGSVPTWISQVC